MISLTTHTAPAVLLLAATCAAPLSAQLRFERVDNALTAGGYGSSGSAWADADGDGLVDVVLAARDSQPTRVYRGSPGGFEQLPMPVENRAANTAAWGDVDADGDMDLLVAGSELTFLETNGKGGAMSLRSFPAGALLSDGRSRGGIDAAAFGDLDTDGDLDLILAAFGRSGIHVLTNGGSGVFNPVPRERYPFAGRLGGSHIVDLDGDDRPDLLVTGGAADGSTVGSVVYWRDGGEWTADSTTAFAGHEAGLGSSVADVDEDGDLDVFVAGWREGSSSRIYLNEGGRRFRPTATVFPGTVVGSAFADLDNDGHLDLVLSSGYSGPGRIEVWRGAGGGSFTSTAVPGLTDVPGQYAGLGVVDLDRDGRLDLHVSSLAGPDHLYRNTTPPSGEWVTVELRPTPAGVPVWGARVVFDLEDAPGRRRVTRSVHQQSGFGGHGEPVAHVGMSAGARLRAVTVTWPGGNTSVLADPAPNQRTVVAAPLVAERLPSVTLPPDFDRVLRAYEAAWSGRDPDALAALFTPEGLANGRASWVRGSDAIRRAYAGAGGDLRLRAVAFGERGDLAYIVGAYGYGAQALEADRGKFILVLQRTIDGQWLIVADLDSPDP